MSLAALIAAAAAATQACAAPSTGVWTYSQPQYPNVGERLIVANRGGRWSGSIGGRPLRAKTGHGAIVLTVGVTGARFEGHKRGTNISGFWIEPKTAFDHARAFRTTLRPSASGWSGKIAPKEDGLRLNVWLLRDSDGKQQLLVRNPDGLIGDTRFAATVSGCGFDLQDLNNAKHIARLDVDGQTINLKDLSDKLRSVPLIPEQGEAIRPSPSITASANAAGLDSRLLESLMSGIAANDPTSRGVPLIHSLLVARHGKLVAEGYYAGYSADRLHELRSLSKSFVPLLAGAAILHRVPVSGDTTVGQSFPAYAALPGKDGRKAAITLEQLLAMRSGLACDDFDDDSPGNEDRMQAQTAEPDWYRFFLNLPVTHAAGSYYAYCSAGTHLAAGLVAARAGRSVLDIFDDWIARPLGITDYSLPLDPEGRAYFGGGAHLTPRDVLKIGQLVLNGGRWHGRQIIDARWLAKATSCPADDPACSEGLAWHFNTIKANGRSYREIEANGNGGQLLMLYPELDLVIVITAANFNAYPVWRKFREELVPRYILAGIKS